MNPVSKYAYGGVVAARRGAITAILLSLACVQAHAQDSTPPKEFTLAQARQVAFERNWDLLAARSGVDTATAQLLVAREFPNPSVSLSSAKIGSHENAITIGDGTMRNGIWSRSYDTIAAVSQLIEIAGKRGDRQSAARAGMAGARARFYDAKRTLDQGVTKAYVAALLAENNVRILNESAGYLRREAGIAEARFKAGDISESDLNQIEVNASQFELQAKTAVAAATQARIAVEVLEGVNQPSGRWAPADSLDQLVEAWPPVQQSPANATRADVLAAEADLRSARANLKLQKAVRVSDPTFSVQVEHEPPGGGPPVDTVGVGVSFPLPLWNLNGGNINAAKASLDQSELTVRKARAQVAADIAGAQAAYDEASLRWLRYKDQIRPKAAKVRESVAFAYGKGGASLVDLLDAERTDNDVRLAAAQAMSDAASASADLAAARSVVSENELDAWK